LFYLLKIPHRIGLEALETMRAAEVIRLSLVDAGGASVRRVNAHPTDGILGRRRGFHEREE
jgi:hypothetical protein